MKKSWNWLINSNFPIKIVELGREHIYSSTQELKSFFKFKVLQSLLISNNNLDIIRVFSFSMPDNSFDWLLLLREQSN